MVEMRRAYCRSMIVACVALICVVSSSQAQQQQSDKPFRGGINQVKDPDRPHPVRNDVAQPGEEIVTLRYFKIRKGSFDEFLRVSVEGVWPYFEKLGSRVIGMWKVITAEGVTGASGESKDFDEVYLSTRYASLDHWKASRDGVLHGGNGPDWVKCKSALDRRNALTIETHVIFLKGTMAPGGPYFMPGLNENYEKKPAK
ncbi:MAG TPA: hypothetical protein VNS63_08765 [Blastocatellia bacterium]|nr:hypothetical protein [Blastocatellia bacterium]